MYPVILPLLLLHDLRATANFVALQQHHELFVPVAPILHPDLQEVSTITSHGVVGLAVDSVLLQNEHFARESTRPLRPADSFDPCGGHVDRYGHYHYHLPPACILEQQGIDLSSMAIGSTAAKLMGIALDGFPIMALANLNESTLDRCNGRFERGQYRYFLRSSAPFFPMCFRGSVVGRLSNSRPPDSAAPCSKLRSHTSSSDGAMQMTLLSDGVTSVWHGSGCPGWHKRPPLTAMPGWLQTAKTKWLASGRSSKRILSQCCNASCAHCGCDQTCAASSCCTSDCRCAQTCVILCASCGRSKALAGSCASSCSESCIGCGSPQTCEASCATCGCLLNCDASCASCREADDTKGKCSLGNIAGCAASACGACCADCAHPCGWYGHEPPFIQWLILIVVTSCFTLAIAAASVRASNSKELAFYIVLMWLYLMIPAVVVGPESEWTPAQGFYWGLQVITTVGYGDLDLEHDWMKIFTCFYIFIGSSIVFSAYWTALNLILKAHQEAIMKGMDRALERAQVSDTSVFSRRSFDSLRPILSDLSLFMSRHQLLVRMLRNGSFFVMYLTFSTVCWYLFLNSRKVEKGSWVDALYFSMVTTSTVGFGDFYPLGVEECAFFGFAVIFGMPLFGAAASSFGQFFLSFTSLISPTEASLQESMTKFEGKLRRIVTGDLSASRQLAQDSSQDEIEQVDDLQSTEVSI